jgi:hypothetical protein
MLPVLPVSIDGSFHVCITLTGKSLESRAVNDSDTSSVILNQLRGLEGYRGHVYSRAPRAKHFRNELLREIQFC